MRSISAGDATLANEVDSTMAMLPEEVPGQERVLTPDAQEFVRTLVRRFGGEREALLARRAERQREFLAGELPDFLDETAATACPLRCALGHRCQSHHVPRA